MSPSGARCSGATSLQQPVLNVRTPIRRIDDAFIGGLLATVALGDLSLLIGEASQEQRRPILHPGRTRPVLAHRRLVDPRGLDLTADQRAADHQGSRRSGAGADLVSADPQPADRPRAGRRRPCRRGRRAALGVRLSQARGLRPRALAGRAVLSARGRHQRPRPADQRRHRRRRHARGRGPAGAADRAVAWRARSAPSPRRPRRSSGWSSTSRSIALAAARDRRCRPQPRQGARRAEMVRRLRAAPPGVPVDGARRGRRALAPAQRHGDVHRHRRVHAAGRGPARAGDRRAAQPSLRPARRLHRARARRDRQVHRRLR